jgi:hypothetical protein
LRDRGIKRLPKRQRQALIHHRTTPLFRRFEVRLNRLRIEGDESGEPPVG